MALQLQSIHYKIASNFLVGLSSAKCDTNQCKTRGLIVELLNQHTHTHVICGETLEVQLSESGMSWKGLFYEDSSGGLVLLGFTTMLLLPQPPRPPQPPRHGNAPFVPLPWLFFANNHYLQMFAYLTLVAVHGATMAFNLLGTWGSRTNTLDISLQAGNFIDSFGDWMGQIFIKDVDV